MSFFASFHISIENSIVFLESHEFGINVFMGENGLRQSPMKVGLGSTAVSIFVDMLVERHTQYFLIEPIHIQILTQGPVKAWRLKSSKPFPSVSIVGQIESGRTFFPFLSLGRLMAWIMSLLIPRKRK